MVVQNLCMKDMDLIKGENNMNMDDIYLAKENMEKALKTIEKEDLVNKPSHYNRDNAMEAIDEMILVFGKHVVMDFCLCNVWKYRYRAADKNGEEDLRKSDFYIAKYKELNDAINKYEQKK